jgi:DNA-binding MarR family transcriptional regulator
MARVAMGAGGDVARPRSADEPSTMIRLGRAWQSLRHDAADGAVSSRVLGSPGDPDRVDPSNVDVLDLLARRDGRRMSDLAAAMHVDPATITRAMHRLEAAGLAVRRPVAADGRVVTAHLTAEGQRVHTLVEHRRAALLEAACADFTTEEQERLVELLERFVSSLAAVAAAPSPSSTVAG